MDQWTNGLMDQCNGPTDGQSLLSCVSATKKSVVMLFSAHNHVLVVALLVIFVVVNVTNIVIVVVLHALDKVRFTYCPDLRHDFVPVSQT